MKFGKKVSLKRLVREFGPLKEITQNEAAQLRAGGRNNEVFTHYTSAGLWYGSVGYGFVNREGYYQSAKPMIGCPSFVYDVYKGTDGLPA